MSHHESDFLWCGGEWLGCIRVGWLSFQVLLPQSAPVLHMSAPACRGAVAIADLVLASCSGFPLGFQQLEGKHLSQLQCEAVRTRSYYGRASFSLFCNDLVNAHACTAALKSSCAPHMYAHFTYTPMKSMHRWAFLFVLSTSLVKNI